jgi:hypothetical protein
MLGWANLDTPRKKDDQGWQKLELILLVANSNIQLCTWSCCVPLARSNRGNRFSFGDLTLSQLKARIRKQRTHRQGGVPRYSIYN